MKCRSPTSKNNIERIKYIDKPLYTNKDSVGKYWCNAMQITGIGEKCTRIVFLCFKLFLLFKYEPKFFLEVFSIFSLLKIHHNYENIFPPAVR